MPNHSLRQTLLIAAGTLAVLALLYAANRLFGW